MAINSLVSPALSLDSVYGPGAASKVRDAEVLVVGAGGVGCELVKNLALTGFGSVTLIDLDTIDVSNLNRQFLFRRNHIGKSKATEAASSIRSMVPGTRIHPIMGNVKETRFNLAFFKTFNVVCNALDNLEARRHVNRMCLAAEVPLVESGSTGYNGQCSVIGKHVECYDCVQRPPQKTYAVCTIRSTPDKPVHCIVWAKFLYELIFGPDDDANVLRDLDGGGPRTTEQNGLDSNSKSHAPITSVPNLSPEGEQKTADITQNGDRAHHQEPLTQEKRPDGKSVPKRVRYIDTDTPESFSKRVCDRVFVDDINEQRAMEDLWTERAPPLVHDVSSTADENPVELDKVDLLDQAVWSKQTSAAIFKGTLQRIVRQRRSDVGTLSFDKDDRDAMMFVASAANLRAHAYAVPLQSPFAAKGIAGNIIHAVATTNAVVGGLIVLEALKITTADGGLTKSLTTYVSQAPRGSRARKILSPEQLQAPNPKCFVCSKGQLYLSLDVKQTSLQVFVNAVLQKRMSIKHPGVHVTTGEFNNTLYESGGGLEEDEIETYNANLSRSLHELKVEDGSQLVVEDFAQNVRCMIHVAHTEKLLEENSPDERFILSGDIPSENNDASKNDESVAEDVDGIEEVELSRPKISSPATVVEKKRALDTEAVANGEPEAKRIRT